MLAHDYPFDSVQMPLNCFDGTFRSFEQHVLPVVNSRGMAALGMKSLGGDGQPILHGVVTVEEALRYAMSLPVVTTISGIDSPAVLRQNLAIARGFKPMTPAEMDALRGAAPRLPPTAIWNSTNRPSDTTPTLGERNTAIRRRKNCRCEWRRPYSKILLVSAMIFFTASSFNAPAANA